MVKFKFNPFLVVSIICIFLLIGYFWAVYLPFFEGLSEYDVIRFRVIVITVFLLIATVPVLLLMKTKR